jgi:acyl-CoA thioester hydrolase
MSRWRLTFKPQYKQSMPRADFIVSCAMRVRYGEVDPQAVVYHPRYLDYADIAITEYWRAFGLSVVSAPGNPEFQLVQANVAYRAPVRIDEEICVCARTTRIGRASLSSLVEIYGASDELLRATIEETHVNVDLVTKRSTPIPAWVVERIESFEKQRLAGARDGTQL